MLARHLHVSLKNIANHVPAAALSQRHEYGGHHVIAIVGAGASAPVLERGPSIRKQLEAEFARDVPDYQSALTEARELLHFEPDSLETALFALSRTPQLEQRLRQRLAALYNRRHPMLLIYELLAHLLKHRFLDAIITLNFDELLDQSLFVEAGPTEHVRIISERDCQGVESDPASTNYVPIYLKLHGTASDPDTLRFTKHSYYHLPDPLKRIVRDLLGTDRCIILNIGSALQSFDLTALLNHPHALQIYNLSHTRLSYTARREIRAQRGPRPTDIFDAATLSPKLSPWAPTKTAALVDSLVDSIRVCCNRPNEIAHFRSVIRHRIVSALLNWDPSDLSTPQNRLAYLADRTTLEMAFSAVRGRGLVSITSLVNDRCAKYYEALRKEAASMKQVPPTWIDVCRMGGLQLAAVSSETFVSIPDLRRHQVPTAQRRFQSETELDELDVDTDALGRHIARSLNDRTQRLLKRYGQRRFISGLEELHRGTDIEVQSRADSICSKVFSDPIPLATLTALRSYTHFMLVKDGYNQLAAVAETGEWLLQEPFLSVLRKKRQVRILLIVAFHTHVQRLRNEYKDRIQIQPTYWWRHNRHMTLVCSDNTTLAGLYFARRQRSLFITPVCLAQEADRKLLWKSFVTYWKRAAMMPRALRRSDIDTTFDTLWVSPQRSR